MKKIYLILISLIFIFSLAACQPRPTTNEIRVGTIDGPETQLMEIAKQIAQEKYNLIINIVPFTDFTMPNIALNDGSIEANMFQTIPYLDADVKAHQYQFSIIGKTFIYPMAVYSLKIKDIQQTPDGAIVAIPNDPSNEGRALLLLQKAKLITLKPNAGFLSTPEDVIINSRHLVFKELDAAQLPRVLPDVSLAVINTNFAIPAGLYPSRDSIYMEDKNSPYANIVVVRESEKNDPRFQKLMDALHSPAVVEAANKLFEKEAIAAF